MDDYDMAKIDKEINWSILEEHCNDALIGMNTNTNTKASVHDALKQAIQVYNSEIGNIVKIDEENLREYIILDESKGRQYQDYVTDDEIDVNKLKADYQLVPANKTLSPIGMYDGEDLLPDCFVLDDSYVVYQAM